jgi:hypothetical protein
MLADGLSDNGYDNAQYTQQGYPQQAYPAQQNAYPMNPTRPISQPYDNHQSAYVQPRQSAYDQPQHSAYDQPQHSAYGNQTSTQDVYAAYDEPSTQHYPSNTRSPPPPLAPQPHRINTQMSDPDYALGANPTSPEGYAQMTRAQDAGPASDAPPMYESGAASGYPPSAPQGKGGYFH